MSFDPDKTDEIPLVPTPVPSWHILAELEFHQRAILRLRERFDATFAAYFRKRKDLHDARDALEAAEEQLDMAIHQMGAAIMARQKANDAFMATYRRELERLEQREREVTESEAMDQVVDAFYDDGMDQEVDAEGRNRDWGED